jgi:hypothetical protein
MADASNASGQKTTRSNILTAEDICSVESAADLERLFNADPQKWFKYIKRANNTIRHQGKLATSVKDAQRERDLLQDQLQLLEDQNNAKDQLSDEEETYEDGHYRDQSSRVHNSVEVPTSRTNQEHSHTVSGRNPNHTPSRDPDNSDQDEIVDNGSTYRHRSRLSRGTSKTPNRIESRLKATMPDPDKFNGDSKDLNRWLSEMSDKLTVDAACFGYDDRIMVIYTKNRLTGTAFDTVTPLFHNGRKPFNTPEELLDHVKKLFGDPDREANAWDELEGLQMKNRSFQEYYADFRRIVADIPELSDKEQIRRLEKGLSKDMKVAMVHGDEEDTKVDKYAERCRRVYRRLTKARASGAYGSNIYANQNRASTRSATVSGPAMTSTTRSTSTIPARYQNPSTPMTANRAIDDPRFPGQVPAAKRLERQQAGHCLRCDKPGHGWRDCPHLPSDLKAPVRVNEATVTLESENEESRT